MRMIRDRFVAVSVMIIGLVLINSPTQLFADTNAHYGKDGINCSPHMVSLQAPPANGKMVICAGTSGATSWYAEVKNPNDTVVCKWGDVDHPKIVTSPQQFDCPIPASNPPILYRGYIHWVVGVSTTMNHTDQYFKK